jgi:hypothetical protein
MTDHVFLTGFERLDMKGTARRMAHMSWDMLETSARLRDKWADVSRLYWSADELDKAARALAALPPPPTV